MMRRIVFTWIEPSCCWSFTEISIYHLNRLQPAIYRHQQRRAKLQLWVTKLSSRLWHVSDVSFSRLTWPVPLWETCQVYVCVRIYDKQLKFHCPEMEGRQQGFSQNTAALSTKRCRHKSGWLIQLKEKLHRVRLMDRWTVQQLFSVLCSSKFPTAADQKGALMSQ